METSVEKQPVTAWFRADAFHPALPGYYEVRNNRPLSPRSFMCLFGSRRYWDGARWLTNAGGVSSIFGRHDSHEWRGRRRWVLRSAATVLGGLYFVGTKPGGLFIVNSNPMTARTFDSKAKAAAAARRLASYNMGFMPVLP